jgi:hypothetical protein
MGDMFAQPAVARLRGVGARYSFGSASSNMCRDEGVDIRTAITNAAANSDKGATAPVSAFAVEGTQTAAEESGCFERS